VSGSFTEINSSQRSGDKTWGSPVVLRTKVCLASPLACLRPLIVSDHNHATLAKPRLWVLPARPSPRPALALAAVAGADQGGADRLHRDRWWAVVGPRCSYLAVEKPHPTTKKKAAPRHRCRGALEKNFITIFARPQ
jgi:hypothetical protein